MTGCRRHLNRAADPNAPLPDLHLRESLIVAATPSNDWYVNSREYRPYQVTYDGDSLKEHVVS